MRTCHLLISALALVSLAAAQSPYRVIPAIAEGREANDLASYPFGRTGFRTQQIVAESAIATSGGAILGIEYRADNDNSIGSPAVTVTNVSIDLSQTSQTPTSMSTLFANNVTGAPVTLFQGSLSLPAYSSTPGGVAPWFSIPLTAPFPLAIGQGDLLIDITAANGGSTRNSYVIDAALPGGTVNRYGTSGQLSQADGVRATVAGNGSMGRFSGIVPGGQFTIILGSQFFVWSGALLVGVRPLPQPIDLGPVGAPNNSLYIDALDSYPYTLQRPPIGFGFRSTWPLSVPPDPNLPGAGLHLQHYVIDPPANSLGVVAMNATEIVIGDAALHPVRQVNSSDHLAPSGTFQYVSGIHGGAVLKLTGGFQ